MLPLVNIYVQPIRCNFIIYQLDFHLEIPPIIQHPAVFIPCVLRLEGRNQYVRCSRYTIVLDLITIYYWPRV